METCKNCLHYDICTFHVTGNENEKCTHYTPTADVVPKSEVDEIISTFEAWLYKHYNGDITEWEFYKLFAELKKKYTEER